jgi:hypothetical protein
VAVGLFGSPLFANLTTGHGARDGGAGPPDGGLWSSAEAGPRDLRQRGALEPGVAHRRECGHPVHHRRPPYDEYDSTQDLVRVALEWETPPPRAGGGAPAGVGQHRTPRPVHRESVQPGAVTPPATSAGSIIQISCDVRSPTDSRVTLALVRAAGPTVPSRNPSLGHRPTQHGAQHALECIRLDRLEEKLVRPHRSDPIGGISVTAAAHDITGIEDVLADVLSLRNASIPVPPGI